MAAKPATKSEVLTNIANATQLSRKQVSSVFDALSEQIKGAMGKKGPGLFIIPGLAKISCVTKPATKAQMWVNPFTKKEEMRKAKPATKKVKLRALKGLKDYVK